MSVHPRVVRRLRLRAPNDTLARRGAILLEDALNTASLPGADAARLLVIRRLSLGRIRADASPSRLALTIERRLWQLGSAAVHALDPRARDAPIVYFRDAADAHVALALRLASGGTASEWFWPLALPVWRRTAGRDDALRGLVHDVARLEGAPLVVARLVLTLAAAGVGDVLLRTVTRDDGNELLDALGWSGRPSTQNGFAAREVDEPLGAPLGALLDRWIATWGKADPRSIWLAAVVLIAERRAHVADPALPARAAGLVERALEMRRAHRQSGDAGVPITSERATGIAHPDDGSVVDAPRSARGGPAVESTTRVVTTEPSRLVAHERRARDEERPAWRDTSLPNGRPTAHAGLFFLVQALARLGMARTLDEHPNLVSLALPAEVLRRIAQAVEVPTGDPVTWPLVARVREDLHDIDFVAPEPWWPEICASGAVRIHRVEAQPGVRAAFDSSGRLLVGAWHRAQRRPPRNRFPAPRRGRTLPASPTFDSIVDAWTMATRRWCRRYSRLGLSSIVCRPGRIAVTETHVDVTFDRRAADIRVRRAGLDLDPGWVPWLERVVQFHYVQENC